MAGSVRKRQLKVWVSEDVYRMLQELAPRIYGRPYGSISYTVERALRAYLSRLREVQVSLDGYVKTVFARVLDCISESYGGFLPDEVPATQLIQCISEVRGADPRTIKKWIGAFASKELIKDLSPDYPLEEKVYEIVARVRD